MTGPEEPRPSGLRNPSAAVRGVGAGTLAAEGLVLLLAIVPLRVLGARGNTGTIVVVTLAVVCFVLAGRGRLRQGERSVTLGPGSLCRVPAGTPHDFSAADEPLELLYLTIRVPEPPVS